MNRDEIFKLMSENLRKLESTSETCEDMYLADISLAMKQTAEFLLENFACMPQSTERHFINE